MSFNTTAAESMKAVVHNDHLYRVPGCPMIGKTIVIGDPMFEFINDSFNNVVGSWELRILEICPDKSHFLIQSSISQPQ